MTIPNHIIRNCNAILLSLAVLCGCKEPYVSPYKSPATGYLVVEGYISGNTITKYTLTRSIALPGDSTLPTENGASVNIEGSDNSIYPLTGIGGGVYSSIDTLMLNPQLQYRLRIKVASGEEYLSDFVPFKPTPPVDSVNFIQNGDNSIQIYVNTHDPANKTLYYQWDYDQTFEYHSAELTMLYYDKDTMPPAVLSLPPGVQVFRCWQTTHSNTILVGTSTKLSQDVIYEQPVNSIPPDDIQTSVLYYILVRQYALTPGGYNFLTEMQKNTESLGSVFDAQPTQLATNIHSLSNPTETVIGYISAGTVRQNYLFISRSQIRSLYTFKCELKDFPLPGDSLDMAENFGPGGLYAPIEKSEHAWESNYAGCVVCTTRGGSNIMPTFWPY